MQTEPLAQRRDGACGQAIHCAGGGLGLAARAEWPVVDATITIAAAIGLVKGCNMVVCDLRVCFAVLFPIKSRQFRVPALFTCRGTST